MDEYTADAFANREEPVPLLTVTYSAVEASSAAEPSRSRDRSKKLSAAKMKDLVHDLGASPADRAAGRAEGNVSLQDMLFAKLLERVIPVDDGDGGQDAAGPLDRRSSAYVRRPAFSLPVMTNNFRRFNARIGIVFVFQNRLIRLFTWRQPTHTLSFLAVYTFVCLDPALLVVLPLATLLLFIMVPAFITRHPPPPPSASTSSTTPYSDYSSSYAGPAMAPARTIRPAAETSKDFFRNMRDLQNSMADFAAAHDFLVATIAPRTNFSNEARSSLLFVYGTVLTTLLFISAHLVPWRLIFLLAGYAMTISGHPTAQVWLVKMQKQAERRAATAWTAPPPSAEPADPRAGSLLQRTLPPLMHSLSAVALSTTPPTREVEIFELQHRPLQPITLADSAPVEEWRPHLFTPHPYDPLSPSRIAGDRPRGTRFFEDVQPPAGWAWKDKKWSLDLAAAEWVNERLVVGVGVDAYEENVDGTVLEEQGKEGSFGGWVWDLPPVYKFGGTRDEEVWLRYGDYDLPDLSSSATSGRKEKEKRHKKAQSSRDWEEGVRFDNRGRTGEWRRRRWVRVVQRVGVADDSGKTKT